MTYEVPRSLFFREITANDVGKEVVLRNGRRGVIKLKRKDGKVLIDLGCGETVDVYPTGKYFQVDSITSGHDVTVLIHSPRGNDSVAATSKSPHSDELLKKYQPKYAKMLAENSNFKMVAEALAEKLAHALLTVRYGNEVTRREKQSPMLWLAACYLLKLRVASVEYTDNCVYID